VSPNAHWENELKWLSKLLLRRQSKSMYETDRLLYIWRDGKVAEVSAQELREQSIQTQWILRNLF
jgi:hypothetical protein